MHESKPHTQLELPLILDMENVKLTEEIKILQQHNLWLQNQMEDLRKSASREIERREKTILMLENQLNNKDRYAGPSIWNRPEFDPWKAK